MAETNTTATAEGMSKIVYGMQKDLRPDAEKAPIQQFTNFSKRKKLGEKFSETIWFADEAGLTYGGSDADLFTLNDAVAGESKKVEASGCELVLRSQVSMKRLTTAMEQGQAAYESFYARMLKNMKNSIGKRCDISLMWGGTNIGVVSAESGSAGARALTITDASWLPLAWLGSKGARIDVYDTTGATKRNATTDIVVSSVQPAVTGNIVNVTGLEAELATIVATDIIFFKGAKDEECDGMQKIAGLTTGETYLGVDVNDYPDLWSGNPIDLSSSPLQFSDIQDALMQSAGRGGRGSHRLLVSFPTWGSLASDMDALRVIDSSYKFSKTEYGQEKLAFHTATGVVEIMPTLNMKWGEAIAMPMKEDDVQRIGSADVGFEVPAIGETYFLVLPTEHGIEVRAYSDQFLWTTELPSFVHFSGIAN